MTEIQLTGCVIPNEQGWVYLNYRRLYDQWELPGGHVLPTDYHDPTMAAIRHAAAELHIEADVRLVRAIGTTIFEQNDKRYNMVFNILPRYVGGPLLQNWDDFGDEGFFNLLARDANHLKLSPAAKNLRQDAMMGMLELTPRDTLQ
jgi:hypothetical protein